MRLPYLPLPATGLADRSAIVDLDGTLIRGKEACDGAGALLDILGSRYVIASNNSTQSKAEVSAALACHGLAVPVTRIVLAGMLALDLVARDHPGARVMLLASDSMHRQAENLRLRCVDDRPDIVLLARDPGFSYVKLSRAADAVNRGARLVATNPDRYHPGAAGRRVPETGSLLQALLACATTDRVDVVGKPEPALFEEAMRRLDVRPEDCVVIGDNAETDGKGAHALGLDFLHVGAARTARFADLNALVDTLQGETAPLRASSLALTRRIV